MPHLKTGELPLADNASADLLTPKQAALRLGLKSSRSLERLRREGVLPFVPLGYRTYSYKPGDVDALIAARRATNTAQIRARRQRVA